MRRWTMSGGGGSRPACTTPSAWWSRAARSTPWAATRSPGCTTSTGTARPTSTSASATLITTSPAGHDFICGLQRGRLRPVPTPSPASGGVLRISADGRQAGRVDRRRLPQPRRHRPRPRRHHHRPQLRGRVDPRLDDLRDPPRRPSTATAAPARRLSPPTSPWPTCRAGWTIPAAARSSPPATGSAPWGTTGFTLSFGSGAYFLLLRDRRRRPAARRRRADARRVRSRARTGAG